MKKRCRIIMLSTALLLLFTTPSFASTKTTDGVPAASGSIATNAEEIENLKLQNFTSYIGSFFENPDLYHAINMEGEDISKEYYDNNITYYKAGDFRTLMRNTEGVVDYFSQYQIGENSKSTLDSALLSTVSKGASKTFACFFTNSLTDLEAQVKVLGNYQFDTLNGIVVSATSPTVTLGDYQGSDLGAVTMSKIYLNSTIINGGSAVRFDATVDLYGYSGGELKYYGRYVMSVTGGANGLKSYTPSSGNVKPS